jgi:hypothetical protein
VGAAEEDEEDMDSERKKIEGGTKRKETNTQIRGKEGSLKLYGYKVGVRAC